MLNPSRWSESMFRNWWSRVLLPSGEVHTDGWTYFRSCAATMTGPVFFLLKLVITEIGFPCGKPRT
jgi:hypothetical protein